MKLKELGIIDLFSKILLFVILIFLEIFITQTKVSKDQIMRMMTEINQLKEMQYKKEQVSASKYHFMGLNGTKPIFYDFLSF